MNDKDEIVITEEDCKITPYDVTDYLDSEKACKMYVRLAFEENGLRGLQKALGDVARAKKMTDVAEKSGLSADGNPSADTLVRVIKALGFELKIV